MVTNVTMSGPTGLTSPPVPLRLRLGPTGAGRSLLDGGWWPRTSDPTVELPDLVRAVDELRKPVTHLVLNCDDWSPQPRRLAVAGRLIRLGYYTSQPTDLLTARCNDGSRVDLLVVPPRTTAAVADGAMTLAAAVGNQIHAERLLDAAGGADSAGRGRGHP